MFASKRLGKELTKVLPRKPPIHNISQSKLHLKINQSLPPGISLVSASDFKEWQMDIKVLDANPLYLDQTYRLRFRFSNNYPIGTTSPQAPPSILHLPFPATTLHAGRYIAKGPPTEAPEVTFTSTPSRTIPIHPHIYSNGIICLDLLGTQGWSPVQNVESVCMSIQSMLTGNTKNERPPGNEDFVARNTQRPRDIRFVYEDATV